MKLIGSRSRQEHDEFSDWDYRLESERDFSSVEQHLATSLTWKTHFLAEVQGVTLIDEQGVLFDYASPTHTHNNLWASLVAVENHEKIRDYWIITFKHLKALYRNLDPLCSLGIELSTGRARDIFFQYVLAIDTANTFHDYRKVAIMPEVHDIEDLVGLPYRTRSEKIAKILALNDIVVQALPGFSDRVSQVFNARLAILEAA